MYYRDAPFILKVLEIQRRMSRPDSTTKSKTLYVRASLDTRVARLRDTICSFSFLVAKLSS